MPPKFGTSGVRGLVTELTEALCIRYARAFLATTPHEGLVLLGGDLRPSTPAIMAAVARGAASLGLEVLDCGCLPTPALALAAQRRDAPAIMVTGSHIPADRNGLKFYARHGEITKADESAILAALEPEAPAEVPEPAVTAEPQAGEAYLRRYLEAFGPEALRGLRLGLYAHSSVGRDLLEDLLTRLGAEVLPLGRSAQFVPVDTEAVSPETRAQLAAWAEVHKLDAIVSTDGDADRPLVADATGRVVPGDVLGPLTAQALGATEVVTPVSSNSLVAELPGLALRRTRIGSPHVIAGMEAARAADPAARVVGYEANGGFLLGFEAALVAGPLPPLPTRDAVLPMLAPLVRCAAEGLSLAELVQGLPPRHTAADRLTEVPMETSAALVARLTEDAAARAAFFAPFGAEAAHDITDGLRVTFASGEVLHLRPSGNAPELRCYAEAGSPEKAASLVERALHRVRREIEAE